ncbi:hypothetical protein H4R35_003055, partial [Dimargaris xerosporica]
FYDIVDADREDCPFLNEMARTAIELFDQRLFREQVAQLTQTVTLDAVHSKDELSEATRAAIQLQLMQVLALFVDYQSGQDLHFSFHPHSSHSVGQLHMHAQIMRVDVRNHFIIHSVSLESVNRIVCAADQGAGGIALVHDDPTWRSIRHRAEIPLNA